MRGKGAVAVTGTVVVIDGASLTCAAVAAVARRQAAVTVGERAVGAARAAWPRRTVCWKALPRPRPDRGPAGPAAALTVADAAAARRSWQAVQRLVCPRPGKRDPCGREPARDTESR
jgi:hypothetical protein